MPMVNIRHALRTDAPLLPAIERSSGEAFRQIAHLAWIADDEVQSVERHLELIEQGKAWIAQDEHDTIVGFLSAERKGNSLHIWQMSVHADHQKKGFGRGLVEAVKAWSANEELYSITITTFREVAWNEPFYHSCGFERIKNNIPSSLQCVLDAEEAAGLPVECRCAMVHKLHRQGSCPPLPL